MSDPAGLVLSSGLPKESLWKRVIGKKDQLLRDTPAFAQGLIQRLKSLGRDLSTKRQGVNHTPELELSTFSLPFSSPQLLSAGRLSRPYFFSTQYFWPRVPPHLMDSARGFVDLGSQTTISAPIRTPTRSRPISIVPQPDSSFLALPLDIHRLTYDLVICSPTPINIDWPRCFGTPVPTRLAIAHTCRALRLIASPIYYGSHTFVTSCYLLFQVFLVEIGTTNANSIRDIYLRTIEPPNVHLPLRLEGLRILRLNARDLQSFLAYKWLGEWSESSADTSNPQAAPTQVVLPTAEGLFGNSKDLMMVEVRLDARPGHPLEVMSPRDSALVELFREDMLLLGSTVEVNVASSAEEFKSIKQHRRR